MQVLHQKCAYHARSCYYQLPEILLEAYPWLEAEDIQATLVYARRLVAHERIEPLVIKT